MLIAQQKKEENIAEYILYMWQLEDTLRALQFDIEAVTANLITPTIEDEAIQRRAQTWYSNLMAQMKSQKIETSGHLSELQQLLVELFYLHNTLLNVIKDADYQQAYANAQPYIQEFIQRSNNTVSNEIEACLNGLYLKLMLRMQKKEISEGTEAAMQTFSVLLAHLALQFKKMKNGEGNFQMN